MSAEVASYASASNAGWDATSNVSSAEEISQALATPEQGDEPQDEEAKVSQAASELGKRGAEARRMTREEHEKAQRDEGKRKAAAEKAAPEPVDEPDEEAEPAAAKATGKPLGKPKDDPRARIQQLAAQRREAEAALQAERQERAREREELARLRAAVEAPREAPRQGWTSEQGKPRSDQFENYEDYLDARDAYNRQTWEAEQEERRRQEHGKRAIDTAVKAARDRVDKHVAQNPDFWDRVTEDVASLRTTMSLDPQRERPTAANAIADEIFNSEMAPALMLHLSEHPEDLQRIASLPSRAHVTREMAKLEARLGAVTTATSPKPATVSKAAPPVRLVTGSPSAGDDPDSEEDFGAMVRRRRAASRR